LTGDPQNARLGWLTIPPGMSSYYRPGFSAAPTSQKRQAMVRRRIRRVRAGLAKRGFPGAHKVATGSSAGLSRLGQIEDDTGMEDDSTLLNVGAFGGAPIDLDSSVTPVSTTSTPSALQSLLAATPGILQGTATVVKAANTPGLPYAGIVGSGSSGKSLGAASLGLTAGSSTMLWIVVLGGVGFLLLRGGRR
jgi:hypothetical protein